MTAQKKVVLKAPAKAKESVETLVAVGQEQVGASFKAGMEVLKKLRGSYCSRQGQR